MRFLLTLSSFAAIIGMAVPAHADSTDDAFLASLNAAGITYSDPDKAVGAGKWVCDRSMGEPRCRMSSRRSNRELLTERGQSQQVRGNRCQRVLPGRDLEH